MRFIIVKSVKIIFSIIFLLFRFNLLNLSMNLIEVYNLGRLNYKNTYQIQKYFVDKLLKNADTIASKSNTSLRTPDVLLLVEHDPVYTVGIRRTLYKEAELDKLKQLNASVERTNRGGLITFHGPGQLVAYPIMNLKFYKPSVKWYVSQLESTIINLCQNAYKLKANRLCTIGYTGVWVNDSKIAAIGIHCTKYITYHGLSLNCNVDLNWFKHIVPCGIEDKTVTSFKQLLNRNVSVEEVTPKFLNEFKSLFNAELILKSNDDVKELIKSNTN